MRPEKGAGASQGPVLATTPADLAIENVSQSEPDFWIVRVRNKGGSAAAATDVGVRLQVPGSPGGFPAGSYNQKIYPGPGVKAGGVTDINVKTPYKTKPGQTLQFILNPNKTLKESNYDNNSQTAAANPAYK